jgi:poly(3-hydroxybutyrate) depolymerase
VQRGRGERIRTSGPCLPKAVLYRAELLPDTVRKTTVFDPYANTKKNNIVSLCLLQDLGHTQPGKTMSPERKTAEEIPRRF